MGNVIQLKSKPNKYDRLIADKHVKNATKMDICINDLQCVLTQLQILNIKHDVGINNIHEILGKFSGKRDEILLNAKQLRGE